MASDTRLRRGGHEGPSVPSRKDRDSRRACLRTPIRVGSLDRAVRRRCRRSDRRGPRSCCAVPLGAALPLVARDDEPLRRTRLAGAFRGDQSERHHRRQNNTEDLPWVVLARRGKSGGGGREAFWTRSSTRSACSCTDISSPPTGASFLRARAQRTQVPQHRELTWRRPIGRRSHQLGRLGQRPSNCDRIPVRRPAQTGVRSSIETPGGPAVRRARDIRAARRDESGLASVLVLVLGLPICNDTAVRGAICRIVAS